jgi:hypothetical protein
MKRIGSSILPFSLSIEYFKKSHELLSNERYQLPARCIHFAGVHVLSSLNTKKEAFITLSLAMKAHVMENLDSSKQATSDTCQLFCYDYVTQNTKTCAESLLSVSSKTMRRQSTSKIYQERTSSTIWILFDFNPPKKILSYSISWILLLQDYTSPTAILSILFDFCNCFLKELQQHHDEVECNDSPTNLAVLIEDFEACLDTVSSYLQSKKGGLFYYLNLPFLSINCFSRENIYLINPIWS